MAVNPHIPADLSTLVCDPKVAADAEILFAPKTSAITRDDALSLGREYANLVRIKLYPAARIFVFGSTVTGAATLHSDIDIAVILDKSERGIIHAGAVLTGLARQVSWDIEIHAVAWTDWRKGDPHVFEIQKWGVEV